MQNAVRSAVVVNQTLPKVLKINRLTGRSLASQMHYSESLISKWANGRNELHFEDFERLIGVVSRPTMIIIEWMNKSTHLIPPLATGTKFKKEPDSLAGQMLVEINEAVSALNDSMDEFRSAGEVNDLSDPVKAIEQLLDVDMMSNTLKAVIENKYGISITDIERKREKKWLLEGYIAKE